MMQKVCLSQENLTVLGLLVAIAFVSGIILQFIL